MSCQTGILCSEELRLFLASCREGCTRCVKVSISESEQPPKLELDTHQGAVGSWEEDWELPDLIDHDQPCFLLYRLDERDSSGGCFRWILLSWSPDHANTRQKMLYASTKATFKKEFGQSQIKQEIYANMKEEVTLAGYKRHQRNDAAPGPLSREEEEMLEIKKTEVGVDIGVDSKHQTLSSLAFPFERDLLVGLDTYWRKGHDYLQIAIDLERELVYLAKSGSCETAELPGRVPEGQARYHLFRFKHSHEGDYLQSNVFIYSMPGFSSPIKERMLYSSCKNSVVEALEKVYNIEIAKKIEVDSGEELTEEFLHSEIHPVVSLNKPKFSKPAAPSRGARRITKAPPS